MAKVRVVYDHPCDVVREGDPNERYDGDDLVYSTYINGIALGESYGDIETAFDVHSNVPYYLLYAIYSTGDSFHLSTVMWSL